jgi:xanthine/uracil permease
MQATSQTVLYANGKTQVTRTDVTHGSFAIPLANIQGVQTEYRPANRLIGGSLLVVGVALAIIGYFVWRTFLTPVFAGIVVAIIGLVLLAIARERFLVRLNTATGKDALIHVADQSMADEVAAAINQALAQAQSRM